MIVGPATNPKMSRLTRNIKTLLPDEALTKAEELAKIEARKLEEHLLSLSPFNKRWKVQRTLSSGSYGVVFLCDDPFNEIKGVVKVAHHTTGADTAGWEAYIMDKVTNLSPIKNTNIVKLLDKGILVDTAGQRLNFMVLECCELSVKKYLAMKPYGPGRKARTCQVLLGALKGIYDLHNQGLLHRDLKPENMGIKSKEEPITLLYDLGMARMFTDQHGTIRQPRTVVPFKGTIEWASGHAVKGREQSRWDDLIAWLYIAVELFDPNLESEAPYPWDNPRVHNTKAIRYLKSTYAPAKVLLKNCPRQFYSIHTYLLCSNRMQVPAYEFIAKKCGEAMNECMEAIKGASPSQMVLSMGHSTKQGGVSAVSKAMLSEQKGTGIANNGAKDEDESTKDSKTTTGLSTTTGVSSTARTAGTSTATGKTGTSSATGKTTMTGKTGVSSLAGKSGASTVAGKSGASTVTGKSGRSSMAGKSGASSVGGSSAVSSASDDGSEATESSDDESEDDVSSS